MANLTTISRPYAKAILSLAHSDADLARWSQMLEYLSLVVQDPNAQKIIRNLALSPASKVDFILGLDARALDKQGQSLVYILATSKRLEILPALYELYEVMRRRVQNQVDLNVTMAEKIDTKFQEKLQQMLTADVQANTEMHYALEPDLIAGGKLQVGDRVVESSVRGRLQALYNDLIR